MSKTIRCGVAVLALVLAGPVAGDEKKSAPVSGKFTGNGQEAKLAHASASKHDSNQDWTVLIFTEKDHAKAKNPQTKALFGDFGSALVITVTPEGTVVGCSAVHAAHKKSGFTDIGTLETADFKIADGKVSGKLTTGGVKDTFGEKWEVDLKFEVKKP